MDGDQPRLVRIHTDRLGRTETQIRAQADSMLIAEYAQAMLRGAEFPPVVVFDDGKFLHLGDGYHRADAAALACTKDPKRPNTILAEVRKGTLEDALRYAMRANHAHGKRLTEEDYGRAIKIALQHGLIEVQRAKEVVPKLMALIPGLSARYSRQQTADYRKQLIIKRDRLIAALHAEGQTQQQIADQLEVKQRTVSDVISRLSKNGATAKTTKPAPEPPSLPKEELPPPKQQQELPTVPAAADTEPAIQRDFTPLLPLLDDDDPAADDETGIVAGLAEQLVPDDSEALAALNNIDATLSVLFEGLHDLKALEGKLSLPAVQPVHLRLLRASTFLTELAAYLNQRGLEHAS